MLEGAITAGLIKAAHINKEKYEQARLEIATRVLIAGIAAGEPLNPRELTQVAVAMADELLAELANPTPRHR